MAKGPYRTIVYVDGLDFYYGEVRGTPWKWLDPVALFQKVRGPQNKLVIAAAREGAESQVGRHK